MCVVQVLEVPAVTISLTPLMQHDFEVIFGPQISLFQLIYSSFENNTFQDVTDHIHGTKVGPMEKRQIL